MEMIKLTCPSCAGALEVPNNLGVVHCMYCGTKIMLASTDLAKESEALRRYIELCKVALQASNYLDALQYCNKILEIDPKNVDAWIDKATATWWQTNGANNRFDEAMGYLAHAEQLSANTESLTKVRLDITLAQAKWLSHLEKFDDAIRFIQIAHTLSPNSPLIEPTRTLIVLNERLRRAKEGNRLLQQGINYRESAVKIWNIYINGYPAWEATNNARRQSQDNFITAMNCYIAASDLSTDNVVILENIARTAKEATWIQWSDKVRLKIKMFEAVKAKPQAEWKLAKLREEWAKKQQELEKLRTQRGLFTEGKIKSTEDRIRALIEEMKGWEQIMAYELPKSPS